MNGSSRLFDFLKKKKKSTTSSPLQTPLASHIQPHIYCVAARAASWEALKLFTDSQDTERREINLLRLGGGKSKLNKTYLTSFHAPLSQLRANNLPGALSGGWAASGLTGFAAQEIIIHKTQGKKLCCQQCFQPGRVPSGFHGAQLPRSLAQRGFSSHELSCAWG